MLIPHGRVHELVRHPAKSMAGTPAEPAVVGWHGLDHGTTVRPGAIHVGQLVSLLPLANAAR